MTNPSQRDRAPSQRDQARRLTPSIASTRWRTAIGFARYVWRHFREDQCTRTAEALSFLSLFAVVPLLTVIFTVLSAIPAFAVTSADIRSFVSAHFLPSSADEILGYLLTFAEQARNLSGIGLAFLIVTALAMLTRIEQEFNAIWRTHSQRLRLGRVLRYWAILSLGPLCIGLAIGISTYLASRHVLFEQVDIFGIHKFLFVATPYLLTAAAFTLLFTAVPNCRVPLRHAALGGAISALCFEIAKYAFARVMAHASYQLIYGAFAAIPLLMLWLYTSWVIVLAGAELVHAFTHYSTGGERTRTTNLNTSSRN